MTYDQFNCRFKHQALLPPEPTRQEEQVRQPNLKILAKKPWRPEKKAQEATSENP